MDSNHQWQKHRVDERVNSRRKEAETHRMIKQAQNEPPRDSVVRAIVRLPVRLVTALFGVGH